MMFLAPLLLTALTAGSPGQAGAPSAPAPAADEAPRLSTASPSPAIPSQADRTPATPSTTLPSTSGASDDEPGDLPVSLGKIQRSLSRPPAIRLNSDRVVFRVEVFSRKLTIEDILGPDYLKGPVPSGGMTHQEFLNMVTPKDYQGYAAFSNGEGLTVAATSFALQWALQKAIHKFETAKQGREVDAARKEVEAALTDLEKARARAGLPPK